MTIAVTAVSAGSTSMIALYGLNVALGGTNLLTGDATELFCGTTTNCDGNTAGQQT